MRIKDLIACQIKGVWGDEPKNDGHDTSVIKTNNMSYEGDIDYSGIVLRSISLAKAKDNYLKKGDLLIEKSGGTKTHSVGYVNYFDGKNDTYVCNNFILGIRPNSQIVDSRFLFWQLRYNYEKGYFKSCASKTTGIQNLKVNDYLNKEIKFIGSMAKQSLIAKQLDSVNREINGKKEVINNLDALIKSLFVEMFVLYLKDNSNQIQLSECSTFIDYMGKTPEKSNAGIRLLTAKNIRMHYINLEPQEFVSKNVYLEFMTRGFPKPGDLLFSTEAPLGNVCVIPNFQERFCVGQRLITIVPDGRINSRYLEFYISSDYFQDKIWRNSSGSTVKGIKSKLLAKMPISIPPIELQNKFASIVSLIDKSGFVVRKEIKALQELLDKKMDEYFRD